MSKEQELVQYLIFNKELLGGKYEVEMSVGKLLAQAGHGLVRMTLEQQGDEVFQRWLTECSEKKVTLVAKESQLDKIHQQVEGSVLVEDNGLTEIPEGSKTVLVLPPMTREDAKVYTKRLQLLKAKVLRDE